MTQSPASVRCTKGAVPNLAIGSQLWGSLLPNLPRCAIVVSRIAAINLNCLSFSVALRVPLSLALVRLVAVGASIKFNLAGILRAVQGPRVFSCHDLV